MNNEELLRRLRFLLRATDVALGAEPDLPRLQASVLTVAIALLVHEGKLDRFRAVQGLVEAINNPKVIESLELPDWGVPKEEPPP